MFHGNICCPPDERGANPKIQLLCRKWSSHIVRTLRSAVEKCFRRSDEALLGFEYFDWHLQNMWTFSSGVVSRVNLWILCLSDTLDSASRTKQSLRRAKEVTLQDWHQDSKRRCLGWTFLPHPTLLGVQSWWSWKDKMVSLERRRGELVVSVAAWKAGGDVSMILETGKLWSWMNRQKQSVLGLLYDIGQELEKLVLPENQRKVIAPVALWWSFHCSKAWLVTRWWSWPVGILVGLALRVLCAIDGCGCSSNLLSVLVFHVLLL